MELANIDQSLPPISVDKTQWVYGPWIDEPDSDAWVDRGYLCAIRRNFMGALCGYVGIPLDHPLLYHQFPAQVKGKVEGSIDVHGGVTFNEEIEGVYWIGFDCSHYMDYMPVHPGHGTYRTFEYVKDQVTSMVDQAAAIPPLVDHKVVIFNKTSTWLSKVNFVDANNVLLGYDLETSCCEDADWFIADEITPKCIERTWEPEEIPGYYFDTSFFQEIEDEREFDSGGMVVFRITNGVNEKFIHLYNAHNGYYAHGFDFEVNGEKVKDDFI